MVEGEGMVRRENELENTACLKRINETERAFIPRRLLSSKISRRPFDFAPEWGQHACFSFVLQVTLKRSFFFFFYRNVPLCSGEKEIPHNFQITLLDNSKIVWRVTSLVWPISWLPMETGIG